MAPNGVAHTAYLRTPCLLSAFPQMRFVVQALFSALPSMVAVVVLTALTFYVGAVLVTNLFASQFDGWFGHIGRSICTLFQIMWNYNFRLRKRKLLLMSHPPSMGLPGGSGYNAENG